MKVLTICQGGNVRSVALAWLLKYKYGHDAVAGSFEKNSPEMLLHIGRWVDHVVILQKEMKEMIPQELLPKTICYDVGPDRWGNCFHPELTGMLNALIQKHKLFLFPA